jgi:outer membrane protein OmpA-like peptidoglycan-associated protein
MTRLGFLVLCFVTWITVLPASAQSTDDIIKGLVITPHPGFKTLPYGPKGVDIIEPQDVKPPSINLLIPFDYNSAEFTPDAYRILRSLGEALKDARLAGDHFKIAGHTDAKGTAEYNQKLSERRAQAVLNYLIRQYDIEPDRLAAAGYGKTQLADPAHPEDAVNRRVQVMNIGH